MDLCRFMSATLMLPERCLWTSALLLDAAAGSVPPSPSMREKKPTIPMLRDFLTLERSLWTDRIELDRSLPPRLCLTDGAFSRPLITRWFASSDVLDDRQEFAGRRLRRCGRSGGLLGCLLGCLLG